MLNKIKQALSPLIKPFLLSLAIPVGLFTIYLISAFIEVRNVSAFCTAVHPGAPVSSLKELALSHGLDAQWLEYPTKKKDGWEVYFPMNVTIGESGCHIFHNGTLVSSTKMDSF